jgi:hypothetical protein
MASRRSRHTLDPTTRDNVFGGTDDLRCTAPCLVAGRHAPLGCQRSDLSVIELDGHHSLTAFPTDRCDPLHRLDDIHGGLVANFELIAVANTEESLTMWAGPFCEHGKSPFVGVSRYLPPRKGKFTERYERLL